MWWIPAGMAVAGAIQGEQKRKQTNRMNAAAAEQTRWSPWTGMGPGEVQANNNSFMGGAIQGGIQGASLAGNMKQAGMFSEPNKAQFANAADNNDGTFGHGNFVRRNPWG